MSTSVVPDQESFTPLGWNVRAWCRRIGICPATYYSLPTELRPMTVKLRRPLVIEEPTAYLRRIAELQRKAA